jgi:PAS domain S-box-containing protein
VAVRYRPGAPLLQRGEVELVRATATDGTHVLLRRHRGAAPEARRALERELALGRELDPEAVCAPLEIVNEDGAPTLVLRDPGGMLLRSWLAATPPLAERTRVARATARTLARLHACGVLHRDFGPDHLLVGADGSVRVLDLSRAVVGARAWPEPVHPRELAGQLDTLAPEQTGRLNRAVDRRADLYALGAVLHELFTGLPPFAGADALDLVHAHLARPAPPLRDRAPDVPEPLAHLVGALLAKRPEDRPSSATAVLAALGGDEAEADADAVDLPPLPLPTRVYGREVERRALLAALERVAAGASLLRVLTGTPGVGKSTLVRTTAARARSGGWHVLTAEFTQFRARGAAPPVVAAFRPLLRALLDGPPDAREDWCTRTRPAVADHVGILARILPELAQLFPEAPDAAPARPAEAERRFEYAFRRLAACIATPESPLLLVLEQCEWLDDDSRRLLRLLTGSAGVPHLLVLATAGDAAAAAETLGERFDPESDAHLPVPPLDLDTTAQLVSDVLDRPASGLEALPRLLQARCHGNPLALLDTLEALRRDGALHFDRSDGRWHWSGDAALPERDPEDVLPTGGPERTLLDAASAVGEHFELSTLAAVTGQRVRDVLATLRPTLEAGVLVAPAEADPLRDRVFAGAPGTTGEPSPLTLRFARGRLHGLVYGALAGERLTELHRRIGRHLLAEATRGDDGDRLQEAVAQLNLASAPGETPDADPIELATLNLRAGRAALAAARARSAFRFLRTGLGLLGADAWSRTPSLAAELAAAAIRAAQLCGDPGQVERLGRAALRQPLEPSERLRLTALTVRALGARGAHEGARALAVAALRSAGLEPKTGLPRALRLRQVLVRARHLATDLATAPSTPLADDPGTAEAAGLLCELAPDAWQGLPGPGLAALERLLAVLGGRGPSGESAFALTCAAVVAAAEGRLGTVRRLRDAAEDCLARIRDGEDSRLALRARVLLASRVLPSLLPPGACQRALVVAWDRALAAGDPEAASLAAGAYAAAVVCVGGDARSARDELLAFERTLAPFPEVPGAPVVRLYRCFLEHQLCAGGDAAPAARAAFEAALAGAGEPARAHAALLQGWTALLDGDPARALAAFDEASAGAPPVLPDPPGARRLALEAVARLTVRGGVRVRRRGRSTYRRLLQWRGRGLATPPPALLEAVLLAAARPERAARGVAADGAVILAFERAVHAARDDDARHDEALAWSLGARFCRRTGRTELADRFEEGARRAWRAWGREAEAASGDGSSAAGSARTPETTEGAGRRRGPALAGTLGFRELLKRLLEALRIEGAADRLAVVLLQDGQLRRAAAWSVEAGARLELPGPPLVADGLQLPVSIVRYVGRTREPAVLDDPARDPLFAEDPEVPREAPRAVACLPVTLGERLLGVVYLEREAPFPAEGIRRLRGLLETVAVDLENARLYEALTRARDEYRDLFEHAVEGLFRIAPDGQLLRANGALARTLGYGDPDTLLAAVTQLPRGVARDPTAATALLAEARESGALRSAELEGFGRDGRPLLLEVALRCVTDDAGTVRAFEGSLVDVTARREREMAERARAVAEAASAAKSRFLATVSHEIRTPMNAIVGFAELARERAADPTQAGWLTTIHDAAGALLAILDDVLDLSRIEAGRLRLDPAPLDVAGLLEQLSALFAPSASERGLALRFHGARAVADALPPGQMPLADGGRLRQVLVNLVGNALKFTEAGTVDVSVRIDALEAEHVALVFLVEDTGIGMEPAEVERLFGAFEQAEGGTRRRRAGTGLGLAICRELVELMGGTVTVESAPERGSRFHVAVAFPLVDAAPAAETARARPAAHTLSGRHVLVADDNPVNLELCRAFLEDAGARVETVARGDAAIRAIGEGAFDAAVLDLHMPGADGIDTCRALRDAGARLPLLAVTADAVGEGSADLRQRLLEVGFDAVLFKPLDRDALLTTLVDAIAAVPGAVPRIATRRACAASSGDEAPPLDLDRALAHHAGRPQLLLRLLASFREHYADAADRLEARLAADDREDAAGLAHALHGVAGSFGAEPLRRAARELERRLEAGEPAEAAARAFREALTELLAVTGALLEQPPALLQDTIAEG